MVACTALDSFFNAREVLSRPHCSRNDSTYGIKSVTMHDFLTSIASIPTKCTPLPIPINQTSFRKLLFTYDGRRSDYAIGRSF